MYAKQITFRLSPALLLRLEKAAASQMRSVSSLIRLMLAENIIRYEIPGGTPQVHRPIMAMPSKGKYN
jgi:hypothetical protein